MISRILVPLDGSTVAERALAPAVALGRSFPGSEILLMRVVETRGGPGRGLAEGVEYRLARAEATAYLEREAERIREEATPVSTHVSVGKPADEILEVARAKNVSVITLTTHGQGGATRFHAGGTVRKLTSRAERSLLLVRGDSAGPAGTGMEFERLMVPLDGSARGDWALSLAVTIARMNGAELLLAHVVRPPTAWGVGGPTATDQVGEAWMEAHREAAHVFLREKEQQLSAPDLKVRTRVLVAPNVAATLNDLAINEDVSLTVLAAHGESGPGGFPCGCVAHALLEQGTASVLMFQDIQRQALSAPERCEFRAVRPRRHSHFAAAG